MNFLKLVKYTDRYTLRVLYTSFRKVIAMQVFTPTKLLAPYVEALWDYEDLISGNNTALSILPDTASYLCFIYGDMLKTIHKNAIYTLRSGLAGFQSYRSDLGGTGKISGVSARLTPWGMNYFRGGILKHCSERRVDCRDIFPGHMIEQIEENLSLKNTSESRIQYVEQFLLSIFSRDEEDLLIQKACKHITSSKGNCSIQTLARNLNLSERSLERRFVNQIGTTPKRFARVVRLRNAILRRKYHSSWADVAYEVGYYDQSHMIHEFQELYGTTPDVIYPQISISQTINFSGLLNLHPAQ